MLRKMAKEIASVNWKEYLDGARDDTFEEVMLQGIVLGYARGKIDDILTYMGRFIPKIDDWSICDTCCNTFKIANQYQQEVWDFLMPYLDEQGVIDGKPANERNREFELRFVAVMMLNYYLNDAYIDKVLYAYDHMKNDGYYLKMGVAWGLAEAYVKCPEPTMSFCFSAVWVVSGVSAPVWGVSSCLAPQAMRDRLSTRASAREMSFFMIWIPPRFNLV